MVVSSVLDEPANDAVWDDAGLRPRRLLKMSWRLLSSVVTLLILVSGISEREQRSALRISPVLVSRSSP